MTAEQAEVQWRIGSSTGYAQVDTTRLDQMLNGPALDSNEALRVLAAHEPIETYSGLLGVVIRCTICGEGTGATLLEALRRHDLAVLLRTSDGD